MNFKDLKELISQDETKSLELKKSTGELKEGMRSACAFLNSDGGILVFGVSPSLKIIGQIVNESTRRDVAQIMSGIEPAVNPVVEYIDIPGKPGFQAIVLKFNPWVYGLKPYTFQGKPYYRVESVTKVMPRDLFDERIMQNRPRKYAWEMQPTENIRIEDLDEGRIRGAVRVGVEGGRISEMSLHASLEEILEKWELLENGVLNNAAAVLFSKKRTRDFELRMARFRGTDKLHFIDNQRVHGNFYELMDAGMAFFFKHLSLSGEITGWYREEHLDIPVAALREALINAICHRDYEKYQCSIGIAIYDDRIEIESPGLLPRELTPESIKLPHRSYPRNITLASVLYSTMVLENWGSGVKRIMDACKAEGAEEPSWFEETGFVVVSFPFNKLNGVEIKKSDENSQNVLQNVLQNVPQNVPQKTRDRLIGIIQEIQTNNTVPRGALAARFDVTVKTIMRDLKLIGIKWEGPSKTGHWVEAKDVENGK